jgi:DNA invertase Pin-like site-specific DNA recombinase
MTKTTLKTAIFRVKGVSFSKVCFLRHYIFQKRIGFEMNISYERVSTINQDERRQEISFDNYKISGKNITDRPQLNKLMLEVKKGDIVYVESISRLGRNVDDLRKLTEFFRDKEVTIYFLKEGFNTNGNMYKFLLTVLGAVAEMERELIVERIKEGIEKAKRYGTRTGRPIGGTAEIRVKITNSAEIFTSL